MFDGMIAVTAVPIRGGRKEDQSPSFPADYRGRILLS
jgi:hypothetical protein